MLRWSRTLDSGGRSRDGPTSGCTYSRVASTGLGPGIDAVECEPVDLRRDRSVPMGRITGIWNTGGPQCDGNSKGRVEPVAEWTIDTAANVAALSAVPWPWAVQKRQAVSRRTLNQIPQGRNGSGQADEKRNTEYGEKL